MRATKNGKLSHAMTLSHEEWRGLAANLRHRADVCRNEGACNSSDPKRTLAWGVVWDRIAHKIERAIRRADAKKTKGGNGP